MINVLKANYAANLFFHLSYQSSWIHVTVVLVRATSKVDLNPVHPNSRWHRHVDNELHKFLFSSLIIFDMHMLFDFLCSFRDATTCLLHCKLFLILSNHKSGQFSLWSVDPLWQINSLLKSLDCLGGRNFL